MTAQQSRSALAKNMRKFYRTSSGYMAELAHIDKKRYSFYINFVREFTRGNDLVLDLGCGTGISSQYLNEFGLKVVGLDVSDLFLKEAGNLADTEEISFLCGDVIELPFEDDTFDAVSSYNLIEHVPDVGLAIKEMMRVTKDGGVIIILSPNLCSPIWPLKDLYKMISPSWKGRPPWYLTRFEALRWSIKVLKLTIKKLHAPEVTFLLREPSLRGGIDCGDGDAVYLTSPVDLQRVFVQNGLRVLKVSSGGTLKGKMLGRLIPYFNNTISIVARK